MSAKLVIFTIDGIPVSENFYEDEYIACEKMSEVDETGVVVQVVIGDDVYAERIID